MANIINLPYGIKRTERLLAIARKQNKKLVYRRIRHQPPNSPNNDGPRAA